MILGQLRIWARATTYAALRQCKIFDKFHVWGAAQIVFDQFAKNTTT